MKLHKEKDGTYAEIKGAFYQVITYEDWERILSESGIHPDYWCDECPLDYDVILEDELDEY